MDKALWEQKFSVEISARYHDWRRSTLSFYVSGVRFISLVGSVLALVVAAATPTSALGIIAVASAVIAIVNLIDLVWNFDGRARVHDDLYRRFKALQGRIAREQRDWSDHIAEWEADAQAIRQDEPPTLWAVYALCWNQTIERYGVEQHGYTREIGRWQNAFRNFFQFRPHDFPVMTNP